MRDATKGMVDGDECSEELGIIPETLRRYVTEGCPHKRRGRYNVYDTAKVSVWMKQNGKTGKVGRPIENDTPDIEAARLRKENALASKYELQVAREKRELFNASDVKSWIYEHIGSIRTRLNGLGDELSPALDGRDTAERVEIINGRIRELLEELSEEAKRMGVEVSATAAENVPG